MPPRRVRFPYLTGYLSFREIDLLLPLLEKQSYLPPLLFVDGNGRLHPRRAGIATTLGVLIDRPTIGIGKKLLCGQTDLAGLSFGTFRPIVEGGETLGAAVRGHDRFKPVFLSPGHRIDLPSALRLTFPQFLGHRLPEALFQADHLSKRVARS